MPVTKNHFKPSPGPVFQLAEFVHPQDVSFYKTYLGQALFYNCDVSNFRFSSVRWRMREDRGCLLFEELVDLRLPESKDLRRGASFRSVYEHEAFVEDEIDDPSERNYGLIAELYRQLKKSYDERKDYGMADNFYRGEMELKRLSSSYQAPLLRWLHRHFGVVAWYRHASAYGQSYSRPVLWLVFVIALFAAIYPFAGLEHCANTERGVSCTSPAASSVTATTLTYRQLVHDPNRRGQPTAWLDLMGNSALTALEVSAFKKELDYEPGYPWGHLLTIVQLLFTTTLVALFLVAVRRQFRR